MRRILLIDDEQDALDTLRDYLLELEPAEVTATSDYGAAVEQLAANEFDVVYTDLLLPPPGVRVVGGHTVEWPDGRTERFTDEHWEPWVRCRGGIDLVRRTRRNHGPNTGVPIVVMTTFVEAGRQKRIARLLSLDTDPRTVLLPKIGRIRALRQQLGPKLDRRLGEGLEQDMRSALRLSLQTPWTLEHAAQVAAAANQVRSRYRQHMEKRREAAPAPVAPQHFESERPKECTLRIVIDPSGAVDAIVDLLGAASEEHELSLLYDDWPWLRDAVLLNPAIDVRLSVVATMVGQPDDDPCAVPLSAYDTGPGISHVAAGSGNASQRLERMLKQRLLLCYLAASTEPPLDQSEGWGVHEGDLRRVARDGARAAVGPRGASRWGATETEVDLDRLLRDLRDGIGLRDLMQEITAQLEQDRTGLWVKGHEIVNSGRANGRRGWFFNGSMELLVKDEHWFRPTGAARQRVAFFGLAEEVSFACDDGRLVSADELHRRFCDAGMEVVRFDDLGLARTVETEMPDATLSVVAPVDERLLSSFVGGEERERWIAAGAAVGKLPPTILVLEDDVAVRPAREMDQLRRIGVDCMYPSQRPGALDLTKIIDHVICAGYRTRYKGLQSGEDDPVRRGGARTRITHAFDRVRTLGYDGDAMSGAASERAAAGAILVSASKTDKHSTSHDDVALVHRVDFVENTVEWNGVKAPSSSIRWHWLIYERWPWARCILHTHWKALTYHPAFEAARTRRYRLSGSRSEAADLVSVMEVEDGRHGFAVLRDHGEVFVGADWDQVMARVERVLGQAS